METKLLPCWHCGGKAAPFGGAGNHAVKCDTCGVTNEPLIADETTYLGYEGYDTEAKAIEAWNTRHERTCRNVANREYEDERSFTCSECGARDAFGEGVYHLGGCKEIDGSICHWDSWPVWKFCPNCGAKVVEQ